MVQRARRDTRSSRDGEFEVYRVLRIGNPESFWRSLADVGVTPIEKHSFGDHHRYSPNELRRLARHAHEIGASTADHR